jgi:hypothetical protein
MCPAAHELEKIDSIEYVADVVEQVKKLVSLAVLLFLLLPLDSYADGVSRFVGTWNGSRTYNLPNLKGTENFSMKVSRFQRTGLKYEATITRPGWDPVYHKEFFYPGGDIIGVSGKIGGSIYDVRAGRWKISGGKLIWDWYMYYSMLGDRQKNNTTWSIDSRGRLKELRTVGGGRITATAKNVDR